ncbi:filamentous hemagglutinin N-terminal domain-containing protein [Erwinia sp. E_sp_W01_1]|uniref:filamentous hemagglutinin N-terminal domain-containing protein n=3 Tax=Erwinia TaxID=551 RepID=UPI0030D59084
MNIISEQKITGAAKSSPAEKKRTLQQLCRLKTLSLGMLLAFGAVQPVSAGIVADGSAARALQPSVSESTWGVPQVNIQKPNADGVSRNVYSEFDVDRRGVILNNARDNTYSYLGGEIAGNAALAQGEARIILNEVNSRDPSQLNGIIEVAGQRAQVVIANPSGITCNGCEFMNASRATLTTGQAMLENGVLTGYKVNEGTVKVTGNGLYGADDYTDIIARSVKINAKVQANDLKITTGRNQVDANNSTVTKLADDGSVKPELALDVTRLGSIYAGKIRMIGTENGVGVHNAGYINSPGDVVVTADGKITNDGAIASYTNLQLSGQEIHNHEVLEAANITLDSERLVNTSAILSYSGNIDINSGSVDNRGGEIYGNEIHIQAADISNESGSIAANNAVVLKTTSLKNQDGRIESGSLLKLDVADGKDPQGTVIAAGEIISWGDEGQKEADTPDLTPEPDETQPDVAPWPDISPEPDVVPGPDISPEPDETQPDVVPGPDVSPEPDETQPDGVPQLDEFGKVAETDEGVAIRDITKFTKDYNLWKKSSGFDEKLWQLLRDRGVKSNGSFDDVMSYLWLNFASETEITPEMIGGISNMLFGGLQDNKTAENIETVTQLTELMGTCWKNGCK